jgi:C-3',4' desaturase CrtD
MSTLSHYDVAIIGSGIAGMSTAMRLQNRGLSTLVLESHGLPGGCAGYYLQKGFSFDVGATTLVDFTTSGIGGQFFEELGIPLPTGQYIDYIVWLPDRQVTLYRDQQQWAQERLAKLGNSKNHRAFWQLVDKVSEVFWQASRNGLQLPVRSLAGLQQNIKSIGLHHLWLTRYLHISMLDVLKQFHLQDDVPLRSFLAMLIEDTLHSTVKHAPFINACLGISIRGAGLMQPAGGMRGFWEHMVRHYRMTGGELKTGHRVMQITQQDGAWQILTTRQTYTAAKVISAIPINLTYDLAPDNVQRRLAPYLRRNESAQGGAIVVFLGVAEKEVAGQPFTHHQLMHDYNAPLGYGNNMFISVSAAGDTMAAPAGYRAVTLSTHCGLDEWKNLPLSAYESKKAADGEQLLTLARRVYPELAQHALVYDVGTPLTYRKYTQRKNGAVGGYKQSLHNSNYKAVPQHIGVPGFWIGGDTTWPGLGTVAGMMNSRLLAKQVLGEM